MSTESEREILDKLNDLMKEVGHVTYAIRVASIACIICLCIKLYMGG